MTKEREASEKTEADGRDRIEKPYHLEGQVGFILRRAQQRHGNIFSSHFNAYGLSPVQFSALQKIREEGRISQNHLGRLVHMDPATIMGVVNRLALRDLVRRLQDPDDRRRTLLSITSTGLRLLEECEPLGHVVTEETLAPLTPEEQETFLALLTRLT